MIATDIPELDKCVQAPPCNRRTEFSGDGDFTERHLRPFFGKRTQHGKTSGEGTKILGIFSSLRVYFIHPFFRTIGLIVWPIQSDIGEC